MSYCQVMVGHVIIKDAVTLQSVPQYAELSRTSSESCYTDQMFLAVINGYAGDFNIIKSICCSSSQTVATDVK
jgi:hypothetical protein